MNQVAAALGTDVDHARKIVEAFEVFIAEPLTRKFEKLTGYDVAKRNPFVYASLGLSDPREWAERVLADILTSSAEGLTGNWMEEVARIICDGTKPGSGVDLQRDLANSDVELYAIQSTTNTKNAGGRRSDVRAMEADAGALRAQRRHVDMFVAYLFGRRTTKQLGNITHLSSAEFWDRLTGDEAFLQGLLQACTIMSVLYVRASVTDRERVSEEAAALFSDTAGRIDWGKVLLLRRPRAKPKRLPRQ